MKRKFLSLLLIGALSLLPAGCTFKDTMSYVTAADTVVDAVAPEEQQ